MMEPLNIPVVRLLTCVFVVSIGVLAVAKGNLSCYDCKFEWGKSEDSKLRCIYNVSSMYVPRQCQSHENTCKVQRIRLNRVVLSYERNCAETCAQYCDTRGFGVDQETCTYCCNTDGCNRFISKAPPSATWSLGVQLASVIAAYGSVH